MRLNWLIFLPSCFACFPSVFSQSSDHSVFVRKDKQPESPRRRENVRKIHPYRRGGGLPTRTNYRNRQSTYRRPKMSYCYSCMSMEYKRNWEQLAAFYVPPRNFSDKCIHSPALIQGGMVACPGGTCARMTEDRYLAGQPIGQNVFRGCFNMQKFFRVGVSYDPSLMVKDDSTAYNCEETTAHELFSTAPGLKKSTFRAKLVLCTCDGTLCNLAGNLRPGSLICSIAWTLLLQALWWTDLW